MEITEETTIAELEFEYYAEENGEFSTRELGKVLLQRGVTENALWRYSPEIARAAGLEEPEWL